MKKHLIISTLLLSLSAIVFGQSGTFNVRSGSSKGHIDCESIYEDEPDHMFIDDTDTNETKTITTQWTWTKMTGWTDVESDGFTLSNDTIIYTGHATAHIQFLWTLSGTGGNTTDWAFRVYNITDGAEVPRRSYRTTTGATNFTGITVMGYDVNANPNDRYVFQFRNNTNDTDWTSYGLSAFIKVVHY